MRSRGIGTAAVLLCLAVPSAAHADRTVQPGAGTCSGGDTSCGSLQDAAAGAGNNETITVVPGTWTGATFAQSGLTITGSQSGQVVVDGTLGFTGGGTITLKRLVVRGQSGGSALSLTSDAVAGDKVVNVQSSILSGSNGAAAVTASTSLVLNTIQITARHVTISDSGGAPAVAETQNGSAIDTTFHDSIVHGTAADGVNSANNDTATDKSALFADVANEDFRLRVDSPAIDRGEGADGSEITTDIDGEPRTGTWDQGADEFVNAAPSKPALGQPASSVQPGELIGFFASASDPNQALGDAVVKYRWTFGDGTSQETDQGSVTHGYAAPGIYQVQVRAVDRLGAEGPASDAVTVTVSDPAPATPAGGLTSITQLPGFGSSVDRGPDGAPPAVSIVSPRPRQRVKVRRIVPLLRGRATDPSGVRRVELALMRREGARCRWYDGRGAFRLGRCNMPTWFRAVVDDAAWRYAFPRRVRPRPGAYFAFARGTDYAGNRTSAFTRANAIAFRYTR